MTAMRVVLLAVTLALAPMLSSAQTLGTFRWQLQSYCNVLSLVVTQNGGVFTLDGFDDQCGATTRAPVMGLATPNPNGTIEFGLTIVATPSAAPVHVAAAISVATLGGTWRDGAGNAGSFVFTPGAGTGGTPRPAPTNSIAPGSIGGEHIDATEVQRRVTDSCSVGSFVRSIGEDGSVACGFEAGDISTVTPGPGMAGGGTSGNVVLGLRQTSSGAFDLTADNNRGFVAAGPAAGEASTPLAASGPGSRLLWHPARSAFRAGRVGGTQWDLTNVGFGSVAMGLHTLAKGDAAFAMGTRAEAAGVGSVALGSDVSASTDGTFMFGDRSTTTPMLTFAPNEFLVRAAGGVGLYTKSDLSTGVELPANGSQWTQPSDVNAKEAFRDLDDDELLGKIAGMPVREWSYKAQGPSIRHIGPTAQDFHAAFGLGEDPLRIGTLDEAGVALAAVRALEARTRATDDALARENDALKTALAALGDRLASDRQAFAAEIEQLKKLVAALAAGSR